MITTPTQSINFTSNTRDYGWQAEYLWPFRLFQIIVDVQCVAQPFITHSLLVYTILSRVYRYRV